MRTRGSRKAHEEKWRKKKKKFCWSGIGSDSQKLVDTQTLVAHLEFILPFSSWALRESLVCMKKEVLFSSFSNVFEHAFAGRNTQHLIFVFCFLHFLSTLMLRVITQHFDPPTHPPLTTILDFWFGGELLFSLQWRDDRDLISMHSTLIYNTNFTCYYIDPQIITFWILSSFNRYFKMYKSGSY